jgi:hypothetical protein
VIIVLLNEEYRRVTGPCLNARMEKEERTRGVRHEHLTHDYYIRIENCGPLTVEDVSCELPGKTWKLHTNGMDPIPAIEPGDSTRLMVFVAMGSALQVRVTLRRQAGEASYERRNSYPCSTRRTSGVFPSARPDDP